MFFDDIGNDREAVTPRAEFGRKGVVYPALAQVQALNPGALDAAALPPDTRLEQVLLALDLNADQVPDLVVTEACCDKPQLPRKDCDLTCRKTWLRVGGQWKVIETGTPC